mmetsp:Transcript_2943/g.6886  ORF Transcript_2943/g.6886 Transcript_2943/m.6886 type:complete len:216 (-) Transcript_2943:330-977(-)
MAFAFASEIPAPPRFFFVLLAPASSSLACCAGGFVGFFFFFLLRKRLRRESLTHSAVSCMMGAPEQLASACSCSSLSILWSVSRLSIPASSGAFSKNNGGSHGYFESFRTSAVRRMPSLASISRWRQAAGAGAAGSSWVATASSLSLLMSWLISSALSDENCAPKMASRAWTSPILSSFAASGSKLSSTNATISFALSLSGRRLYHENIRCIASM